MTRIIIITLTVLALSACTKTGDGVPNDIQVSIIQCAHAIMGKDAYVHSQPLIVARELFDQINGLSNAITRVRCVDMFVDELCTMDAAELSYSQMRHLAKDIDLIDVREISDTLFASTQDMVHVYKGRMRLTDMLRRMFESVRPLHRRSGNIDTGTLQDRNEWISCYCQLYLAIKIREERIEMMNDLELEQVGQQERQRVHLEAERWLGRTLRTESEICRDHTIRSEEYISVVRDEFDPPGNATRSR